MVCDTDVKTARIVKGRLEKTVLGQIARVISQKLCPGTCFVKARPEQSVFSPASYLFLLYLLSLKIVLNMKSIRALQLSVTAQSVAAAILSTPKLKLKPVNVQACPSCLLSCFHCRLTALRC